MQALLTNTRFDHFCLTSPDPESLSQFYGRGLDMVVESRRGGYLAYGPDRKVFFAQGAKSQSPYAAYALPDLPTLAKYRATLAENQVPTSLSPSPLFGDEAFSVVDPDGFVTVFGVAVTPFSFVGQPQRLPGRLQHFVTASSDIDPVLKFYRDALGFRSSDEVIDNQGALRAVFLRTDSEHHSRAIFFASEQRLDHHCYEAGDWSQILRWGDHMADQRIAIKWGPGRHGPGHNLFFMIHDPDGNWVEISAEIDHVPDSAPLGIWRHEGRTLNSWGQAFLRS